MAFNPVHDEKSNLKTFPVCNTSGLSFYFSTTGNVTTTNVCLRHVSSGLPVIYLSGVKAPHKICRIINTVLARFANFDWNQKADQIAARREDTAEIVVAMEDELRQAGIRDRLRY